MFQGFLDPKTILHGAFGLFPVTEGTLRVHSTKMWSMYGLSTRTWNLGLGVDTLYLGTWTLWVIFGPGTQDLRFLVPKAILSMVFETRVLKHWVLGPSGCLGT